MSQSEIRKEFNTWFDSKYYTIDPIARETAYQSWLAGREAEKTAMLTSGALFGETFRTWQKLRYELMARYRNNWNKPESWPTVDYSLSLPSPSGQSRERR